ncbi:hypothetical protein O9K51_07882 [Purpureocillium lavendulum]|uniref:Integral membrane protein n=1 Tax=Purpureocillium lavendulum TaxID=1247861 RepID=A0AB34FNP2_9HYPO|nr:hypothetical protein O9K51_07882 [Purpureocillium lavendulum]
MNMLKSSPVSGQVDIPSPVWRRIRESAETPRRAQANLDDLPESRLFAPFGGPLTEATTDLRPLRTAMGDERYRICHAVLGWLNTLLQSTTPEGREPPRNSLLGMCLRKIPACVANIESYEKELAKEEGRQSMWDTSNVSFELYGQLETLGAATCGWRPLKLAVRAHGLSLLCQAMAEGLFDPNVADLCGHLYGMDLGSCFDDGCSLQKDVAFLLAQRTKDLRDLAFAESLRGSRDLASGKTMFSGWRWEEGISEWVLPSSETNNTPNECPRQALRQLPNCSRSGSQNASVAPAPKTIAMPQKRRRDSGRPASSGSSENSTTPSPPVLTAFDVHRRILVLSASQRRDRLSTNPRQQHHHHHHQRKRRVSYPIPPIMASRAAVPFLVGMMLLTGVCNTLLTKYQDNQCVRNCDPGDGKRPAHFEQPVLQTAQMFVGEMGCWLVVGLMSVYRRLLSRPSPAERGYEAVDNGDANEDRHGHPKPDGGRPSVLRGYRVVLLALPAICDICGTTLMNAGLLLVAASIYQMTRGALVLFVGLFSVMFLRRHLYLFQWLSLVGVVLGVAVVGLAGAIWPDEKKVSQQGFDGAETDAGLSDAARAIIGVLLIAGAQIFTATQFVLEEWMLENSSIEPIRVVGWEGIFGFVVTLLVMVFMHLAVGRTDAGRYGYFDMNEGLRQMSHTRIWVSSVLIMISIGGFNFFGLSVTRTVSATSRSTIDTCRTLFIWIVSLGLGWESFKALQIVGFAMLVYSTFVFNGIVQPPLKSLRPNHEVEELLPEEPIEHQ